MIKGAGPKELLEFINSHPDWEVSAYYSLCECGGLVLLRREVPYEPFLLVGSEYMETCYECAVVSSD